MKILKVKIKRTQNANNGTHYTYPKEYDPKKIQVLCYETSNMENYNAVVARGNDFEYCVGVVADQYVDGFLASDDIEEMDYNTALSTCNNWIPKTKKITDQNKVIGILSKIKKDKALTQEEKAAINPDDSTIGINQIKSFKEILDEAIRKGV